MKRCSGGLRACSSLDGWLDQVARELLLHDPERALDLGWSDCSGCCNATTTAPPLRLSRRGHQRPAARESKCP
jgi:hypothetical protein